MFFGFLLLLLYCSLGSSAVQLYAENAQDQLYSNNCLKIKGVEYFNEQGNRTELQLKTNLIKVLHDNVLTINQIEENTAGSLKVNEASKKKYFCSDSDFLTLQYSSPCDLNGLKDYLTFGNDALILDFFQVYAPNGSYCLVSGVILSIPDCNVQLEALANLTSFIPPEIPGKQNSLNLFPTLNAKVKPLYIQSGKLLFEPGETARCGEDTFYEELSHLKQNLAGIIKKSIKLAFNFLHPIAGMDISTFDYLTSDTELYDFWQKCTEYHAPAILRAFFLTDNKSQHSEWQFPKLKLDLTTPQKSLPTSLAVYINLLKIVCDRQQTRRSVWSFLFGSDPQIQKLERNSVISHNSFDLVRKNEKIILRNQRLLSAATNHINKNEKDMMISFNQANRRLIQLTYDLGFSMDHQSKLALHEQIRGEFRNALLQANVQLSSLTRDLENFLKTEQVCRMIDSKSEFFCPSEAPSFHVATDLIVSFMATKIQSRPTFIFHCLPISGDSDKMMRFRAHQKHFIRNETTFEGAQFNFPENCLADKKSCRNLYEPASEDTNFGPCYTVNNHLYIFAQCTRYVVIKTESGLIFQAPPGEITRISLTQLPLYSEGEKFSHEDLYQRENTIRQRIDTSINNQERDFNLGASLSNMDDIKTIRGKQVTIQEDLHTFFSPQQVRGSHVMAALSGVFSFCIAFMVLSLLMKAKCFRSVILTLADSFCRCCGPPSEQAGPAQAAELQHMLPAQAAAPVPAPAPVPAQYMRVPAPMPPAQAADTAAHYPLLQTTSMQQTAGGSVAFQPNAPMQLPSLQSHKGGVKVTL